MRYSIRLAAVIQMVKILSINGNTASGRKSKNIFICLILFSEPMVFWTLNKWNAGSWQNSNETLTTKKQDYWIYICDKSEIQILYFDKYFIIAALFHFSLKTFSLHYCQWHTYFTICTDSITCNLKLKRQFLHF